MSYTVLARKYRPQTFADVIGQDHVKRTLRNALTQGRIAHGYIFSGTRGCGKTTVARILAMALNCRSTDHPQQEPCGVCDSCVEIREGRSVDVIEIDAATNRGIDEIRELREAARYRPARDRYKIYILDEAHQIIDAAFNALLKTLEEPPAHIVFMMATTQPEDIPQTIRSRCQHFSFHAVKFEDIVGQLRSLAEQENIKAQDDALAMLAEAGDGSMRDALSIMDQAIACCGDTLTGETVRQLIGAVASEVLEQMLGAVQRNSSEEVLRLVDRLITEGHNPAHFARQMVRFLRNTAVARIAGSDSPLLQISADERARAARVAELFSEEDLTRFLQIMLRTHSELGYKQEQRFHLELGLLKLVHAQRLLPIEQLLSATGMPVPARPAAPPAGPERAAPPIASRPQPAVTPRTQSPFASDLARKNTPRSDISTGPWQSPGAAVATAPAPIIPPAPAIPPAPVAAPTPVSSESELADRLISVVENAGHLDLANMLRNGDWKLSGGEISVHVSDPEVLVKMAFKKEAEQALNNAAAAALGRPARLRIVAGANVAAKAPVSRPAPSGSLNARVAEEPVIRRMQEKFGAEIRSVIDLREKG